MIKSLDKNSKTENKNEHKKNLNKKELEALEALKKRDDIIITSADKGGKILVLEKGEYLEECTKQLENKEFYQTVDADPSTQLAEEIEREMKTMEENNLIGKKEFHLLAEFLGKPRMAIFYGLPKIHKNFVNFPPLHVE